MKEKTNQEKLKYLRNQIKRRLRESQKAHRTYQSIERSMDRYQKRLDILKRSLPEEKCDTCQFIEEQNNYAFVCKKRIIPKTVVRINYSGKNIMKPSWCPLRLENNTE